LNKFNKKQLASLAKYLYDVSKGIFIACVIAGLTTKGMIITIMIGIIQAILLLVSALLLEKGATNE